MSRVEIERTRDRLRVDVYTARPGIVIGRRGAEADKLRAGLTKITGNPKIHFNIQEIKQPELDATLIAQGVADQLGGSRVVPSCDEARRADGDEGRRAGNPRAVRRSSRRCRDVPQGVVPRGPSSAAHAAGRHRLRRGRSADHVRPHRREGLDLQGRDPPVQVGGRRQDLARSRDGGRRDSGEATPRRRVDQRRRWAPPQRRSGGGPGRDRDRRGARRGRRRS